jgi:oligopeptide transport system ATP-binding protein
MKNKNIVLSVRNLSISFKTVQGLVQAVRGVSFDLRKGETLAIVGESGSGKSVSSRAIIGILPGNAIINNGEIIYENQDLSKIREEEFHKIRGNRIGMIFQDPMSSLNPIMKIGKQITESMLINGKRIKNKYKELIHTEEMAVINTKYQIKDLKIELRTNKEKQPQITSKITDLKKSLPILKNKLNKKKLEAKQIVNNEVIKEKEKSNKLIAILKNDLKSGNLNQVKVKEIKEKISSEKERINRFIAVTKKEAYEKAIQIMNEVGISDPVRRFNMYPFQFSGGMRQRIVIAIALTANPDLLICDEPTTALDVTIQAQILELINKLKEERGLSVIFITHDLGVVANVADRVAVMYAGKIVEYGNVNDIFYNPQHPYTWALLSSIPDIDSSERLIAIPGTPPNMLFPPVGDAFADRNKYALDIDFVEQPPIFKVSEDHFAATWLLDPRAPKFDMPESIKKRIAKMKQASRRAN